MSKIVDEVVRANRDYAASFGQKGKLEMPPARRFAVLTCMDARLDPAKFAGLAEGDAHVIRNAGGRASDDAIRSLIISYKLLGTKEWFVIHHTNCGMEFFTNDLMRELLASSLETASLTPEGFKDVGDGPGSREGEYIEWLPIRAQNQSVIDDVERRTPIAWGPDGELIYLLGDTNDEFAGSTFSPNGQTLFVNIQAGRGMTFAIWGPWERIGV